MERFYLVLICGQTCEPLRFFEFTREKKRSQWYFCFHFLQVHYLYENTGPSGGFCLHSSLAESINFGNDDPVSLGGSANELNTYIYPAAATTLTTTTTTTTVLHQRDQSLFDYRTEHDGHENCGTEIWYAHCILAESIHIKLYPSAL